MSDSHIPQVMDWSQWTEFITSSDASKLNKKARKGEVHAVETWMQCLYHSVTGSQPCIKWVENKSRALCKHDINVSDLKDLFFHIFGVKSCIINSFQVCKVKAYHE